ncbi:MAG: FecR domain-containing protein [Proteobacteria bacterium]|nr:FecR domain-containing protein [Pseudomonadota bacterium]
MKNLSFALILCSLMHCAIAAIGDPVGKIDLMDGDVHVFDSQKKERSVRVSDPINEGDSVVTGKDGELHMTMNDDAFIAVRSNSNMNITRYRAEGDDKDEGLIGLVTGSLRSITGWIGKNNPKSYKIKTPTATIGIRGTDHEPKVIPDGSDEGEPGTYDKVNFGGSYIQTPGGSVDVTPKHAGFAPQARRGVFARPRLLEGIPRFYRPSRHERLIEGKHEAIQRTLLQHREERREQIRQKRLEKDKAMKTGKADARDRQVMQREKRAAFKERRQEQREARQASMKARMEERQPEQERRNLKNKRKEKLEQKETKHRRE